MKTTNSDATKPTAVDPWSAPVNRGSEMGPFAAAVVPAAISAGSNLLGALLGSRGQDKAAKAQQQANAEALAFERNRWQAALRDNELNRAIWDQNRRILAQRLGIELPAQSGLSLADMIGASGQQRNVAPLGNVRMTPAQRNQYAGMSLADLAGGA